jgi:hypothetical protein
VFRHTLSRLFMIAVILAICAIALVGLAIIVAIEWAIR